MMMMMMMLPWAPFRPHVSLIAAHSATPRTLIYLSSNGRNQVSVSRSNGFIWSHVEQDSCGLQSGNTLLCSWDYLLNIKSGVWCCMSVSSRLVDEPPTTYRPIWSVTFWQTNSLANQSYRDTYVSVSAGDHMSFHFALNKLSEKLSAPTSEQAGPWISTFPAGLLGFGGIFPRLLGGFFFGLCAWTHMTEQLTRLSQPPSNRAENSGQKRSEKKR